MVTGEEKTCATCKHSNVTTWSDGQVSWTCSNKQFSKICLVTGENIFPVGCFKLRQLGFECGIEGAHWEAKS